MDPGFSGGGGGGGGLMVMRGHMAVARGRVPWKLLLCVLTFVAKFLWHLHARFLLACVFRELVILIRYK